MTISDYQARSLRPVRSGSTRRVFARLDRQRRPLPAVMRLQDGSAAVEGGAHISVRQCQVLELVAAGLTNEQIARRLGISCQTVKHHISHLLEVLDLANRVALAAWWAEVEARFEANGHSSATA